MDFLIDTSFLIRLWRDRERSPEYRFILRHTDDTVRMPWVVKGEFLRGAVVADHDEGDVRRFLDRYPTLWVTDDTLVQYARVYRTLVRSRQMIGANDLWVAASALEHGLPLLTRNIADFGRVESLEVVDYGTVE